MKAYALQAPSVTPPFPVAPATIGAPVAVPGLTTTVNVPANAVVLVKSDGGVQNASDSTTAATIADVFLTVDGQLVPNGGFQTIIAANGSVIRAVNQWSMSAVLTLPAGNHTFAVQTRYVAGVAPLVSGNVDSSNQGQLSVVVIKL